MTAQPSNCKHVSERFLLYNSDWWHMQSVKISPSLRQRRMRRRGTASSLQPMPSCGHNTYLWVPRIGRMELQIKVTSNVTTSSRRKAHLYIWLQSATNHAYSCAILLPKPVRPTADANSGGLLFIQHLLCISVHSSLLNQEKVQGWRLWMICQMMTAC